GQWNAAAGYDSRDAPSWRRELHEAVAGWRDPGWYDAAHCCRLRRHRLGDGFVSLHDDGNEHLQCLAQPVQQCGHDGYAVAGESGGQPVRRRMVDRWPGATVLRHE